MNKDREFFHLYFQKLGELIDLIGDYDMNMRVIASASLAVFNEDGTPFMDNDLGDNFIQCFVCSSVEELVSVHESVEEAYIRKVEEMRKDNPESGKFDNFGFSLN